MSYISYSYMKKLLYISVIALFLASCDKQNPLIPGANPFSPDATIGSGVNSTDDNITDPDKDDDHDVDEGKGLNDNINLGITDPDKDDDHDVDEGSGQVKTN